MPFPTLAADIAYAIQDSGTAVVINGISGYGELRRQKIEVLTDAGLTLQQPSTTLAIQSGVFGTIASDAQITVGSATFVVREVGPVQRDGTLWLYLTDYAP